jgi:hypothetical protein
MYNHPISVQQAVTYHQDELLREARQARLAKDAAGESGSHHTVLNAAAIALLLGILAFVLI